MYVCVHDLFVYLFIYEMDIASHLPTLGVKQKLKQKTQFCYETGMLYVAIAQWYIRNCLSLTFSLVGSYF